MKPFQTDIDLDGIIAS